MWLCLPDAYLSFVHKDCKPNEVLVRARRKGDIETVFPEAKSRVTEYDRSDYQFRAVLTRVEFEAGLVREAKRVVYSNFKNSVRDNRLHDAYMDVWTTMSKLQPNPPYSGFRKASKATMDELFDFGADYHAGKTSPYTVSVKQPKKKQDAQVRKNLKKLTKGQ